MKEVLLLFVSIESGGGSVLGLSSKDVLVDVEGVRVIETKLDIVVLVLVGVVVVFE